MRFLIAARITLLSDSIAFVVADIRRITEELIEVFPVRTPAFADLRIFIVPDFRERIERHQCRLFGRGLIDSLQAAGDGFVVLPGHVFQAVTHHMDDAQLDMGLREDAVYRIREALKTVHAGYQDVLEATVFQLRAHPARTLRLRFRPATCPATLSGLRY